jgi:pimeloyl-ACP methyl ester carboxylesterase
MKALLAAIGAAGIVLGIGTASVRAATPVSSSAADVTVVLVHGAFADSSSWDGVVKLLLRDHVKVVAVAVPLRSLAIDATSVTDLLKSIPGDVVLVGHSYGGQVITAAGSGNLHVKGLVYVDGLAPDTGESAADISDHFPGATLGPALAPPVSLSDGGKDLYIKQDRLPDQFAADVPLEKAQAMAVSQRPVTDAALHDKLQGTPAWKSAPSWFIYGSLDKNIVPRAQDFMAKRARSRSTVVVPGGSHVVMISHPDAVTKVIEDAVHAAQP